jgi:hypothetical protein
MKSKYDLEKLSENGAAAYLGIFSEADEISLKQTPLYLCWQTTGNLELDETVLENLRVKDSSLCCLTP